MIHPSNAMMKNVVTIGKYTILLYIYLFESEVIKSNAVISELAIVFIYSKEKLVEVKVKWLLLNICVYVTYNIILHFVIYVNKIQI